jgi:bifunctional non-homologous end joining protein LigD
MPLEEYRRKRRFGVTTEPRGGTRARRRTRKLRFVVQKHRANALHYDFRLEWDGVLLSWAVPKGPSLDPTVKRLAVAVEDHPIEYAKFEGVIPAGEYGGGTVMIWDQGTWAPDEPDVAKSLAKGELKLTLAGEKLAGSWVLVRTRGYAGGKSWLLIKHRDAAASTIDVATAAPRSVVSDRLLAEIAFEEGGDVRQAVTADPPAAVEAALRDPRTAKRKPKRAPAVWHSKRPR